MNRRSFLSSILLTATAPAIVRADSLMRIVPRDTSILQRGDLVYMDGLTFFNNDKGIWAYDSKSNLIRPYPPEWPDALFYSLAHK